MTFASVKDTGDRLTSLVDVHVYDRICSDDSDQYCFICVIPEPVRRVYVRGLCRESVFDTMYHYNIREDGSPFFMGIHTSTIFYNYKEKQWNWVDRTDNMTLATSTTLEERLLLGLNRFDMSQVTDDKCTDGREDKIMRIKLTTCVAGMFTCDDGECIDIEERCDQTPNCNDKSDENICNMLVREDNYNKKVAPFKFDKQEGLVLSLIHI